LASIEPAGAQASKRQPLARLAAFGAPSLAQVALGTAMSIFLPRYFAQHVGLGLIAVGAAFTLVRLIDIGVDPVLGLLMDRTRTPLGRYRPWIVAGAPIVMLAVYQLFMAAPGSSSSYLVGWLFVLYVGVSILGLAHASWASVLAPTYNERSRVFAVLTVVGVIGAAVLLSVPTLLSKTHSSVAVVHTMGWLVIGLVPATVAIAATFAPERITPNVRQAFRLRDYWEAISRPEMLRIIVADFCLAMGPGWMTASYLFYFHDVGGFTEAQGSGLLIGYSLAGLAGAPLISWLAGKFGKHRTLMGATTLYSIGLMLLPLQPKGSVPAGLFVVITMGMMSVAFAMLTRSMLADVGDAIRLEQGKQRIGLLYAMVTSTTKVAGALSISITYTALAMVGYKAAEGAVNTPAAIHGLTLVFLAGPILFVMLGGACFIGYRLDAKRHGEIRDQLDARDAQLLDEDALTAVPGLVPLTATPMAEPN
jgi:GPH family glycoside/pentoside/hexuronide:cation symporter